MKQRLIKILLIALGVGVYGCKPLVNHMAFYPDSTDVPPDHIMPEGVEEFFMTTEDQVRIHGLYLPAAGSEQVLIYFHGNAGNIFHRITGFFQLRSAGVNVVGVSYRGYGKSEGSPSEEGIYQDADAVFDYVTRRLGFSENNIILFGRSIGASVALNLAQHKNLKGMVLVSPLTRARQTAAPAQGE